jgi:Na+/melibiose symporter-like transporter
LPLVCYGIGAALFSRFKLNEEVYATIRAELDRRAAAKG